MKKTLQFIEINGSWKSYILEKWTIKDQISVLGSPVIVIFLIGAFWNSSEIGSIWIILEMDQAKNLHCE